MLSKPNQMVNAAGCGVKSAGRKATFAAGALLAAALGGAAQAENFYWGDRGPATSAPGITPSIFLSNENVADVDAFLAQQGNGPKSVKIETPLSQSTVNAIFNKYNVNYTFVDYEGANVTARTLATVTQLRASTATGAALAANKSYVSNFAYTAAVMDPSAPPGSQRPLYTEYNAAGLNMVSDDLYPSHPSYRGPASGNSVAPSVRTASFALPITRLSMTTASLPAGHIAVPYVNRFNNWGNSDLDTDGNASNGFQFVTSNQLPSRADFQAQVLHYRLRGAAGVHGLDGGVQGYAMYEFQADITTGWNSIAAVNQLMARSDATIATLDTRTKVDGVLQNIEATGVAFSGTYSLSASKLVLLLSNLDEKSHTLTLPAKMGGKELGGDYKLEAGTHELVQFGATGSKWSLMDVAAVFVSTDADRGGVGVPEPTGLAMVGGVAMIGLLRRKRS